MPRQSHAREGRRIIGTPIVLTGVAALAAFLILNGHGDHLLSLAPLLVLLACPLMHMFMHHGHGRRESGKPGRWDGSRGR